MNFLEALQNKTDISQQFIAVLRNAVQRHNTEAQQEVVNLVTRVFKNKLLDYSQERFFRARIIESKDLHNIVLSGRSDGTIKPDDPESGIQGFLSVDMGAPPTEKVLPGRANTKGERLLYLASDIETACAEVQPVCDDLISVIEFQVKPKLNILDLTKVPLGLASFCETDNMDKLIDMVVAEQMVNLFAIPVSRRTEELYCYSQFIMTFIKEDGYDGVSYMSSHNQVNNSYNTALFNPESAIPIKKYGDAYKCLSVRTSFQSVSRNFTNQTLEILEAERQIDPYLWNSTPFLYKSIRDCGGKLNEA